jgi:hypothetical protein
MKHPAFETINRGLLFIGIFILAGALIPLCLAGLIPVKAIILIAQGSISGLIICGISVLLFYVSRYTKLSGSTTFQGILNHIALLFLALCVWIGVEYLIIYIIFPENVFRTLTSIIPFKIVIGTLIIILVIQFYNRMTTVEPNEDDIEIIPEAAVTISKKPVKVEIQDKITVKSGSNINIIPVSDLLYLQAEGDYVILYTASSRYIKEETMKHMEEQLPPAFLRVHRSSIVNTNYISRIELYEKQHYKITLKTGQQLKASATGYKILKETLNL